MTRDVIESLIIGFLATYLPVFDFSSGRIAGTFGIAVLTFIIMLSIKKEPQGDTP